MVNQKKVLLILPYFGEWPKYFNIYLSSCMNNQWLEIIFFTDANPPCYHPSNVKFQKYSLLEISNLITEKLSLENYELPSAYKLCDFKPCYGVIFENFIADYDYWAYGDIDLIYGNLEAEVREQIAAGFDFISARKEIMSGSLTLVKNNLYNNNLFKKGLNFKNLLMNTDYEGLDETSHNAAIWENLDKLALPASSFTYVVAKESYENIITASFETYICENLTKNKLITYKNKELTLDGKSIGYFHYVMNKRRAYFSYPDWESLPNTFYITETGFYKNFWVATLLSPIIKKIRLSRYYFKRSPRFLKQKINNRRVMKAVNF